jgi:hypothetical protein
LESLEYHLETHQEDEMRWEWLIGLRFEAKCSRILVCGFSCWCN